MNARHCARGLLCGWKSNGIYFVLHENKPSIKFPVYYLLSLLNVHFAQEITSLSVFIH